MQYSVNIPWKPPPPPEKNRREVHLRERRGGEMDLEEKREGKLRYGYNVWKKLKHG